MLPVDRLSKQEAQRLRGVLFDLDDTLLDRGRLSEAAYGALFRLREAGLALVAVTGRPGAWGAILARQWPIDGVVSENGAIAHVLSGGRLEWHDAAPPEERRRRAAQLSALCEDLGRRFPDLRPADDVEGRLTDYAFDIGEHEHPDPTRVAEAAAAARAGGARVFRSSVHLHVTFDADDKASGVVRFLRHRFALDPTVCRRAFAFIGDSENDEACFAAFTTTVAVANLSGRPTVPPRFLTHGERGAGFAEAARVLVGCRTVRA